MLLAVSVVALIGFSALAIDTSNLYVARNELQNAADAGALAGARVLYIDDGSAINPNANQAASDTATANDSQGTAVEVARVRRGHWSFATRTFTPNPSLDVVDLFGKTTAELDADPNFINAVEVVTERRATPVAAFFGYIFGFSDYSSQARAVGYIGFAGKLRPEDVDQPIALCETALRNPDGEYSCNLGRFIPEGDQTGGWTNFEHDQNGATNANELRDLVEGDGNPNEMNYGEDIATNNGEVQSAFKAFYDRWVEETDRERPWNMTLPVIDCDDGIAPANPLVGAVTVNIMWVINQNQPLSQIDTHAPQVMGGGADMQDPAWPGDWANASPSGTERWDSFTDHFALQDSSGQPADWRNMSIYFLPSCSAHQPSGSTGGENFGVLARIPVLVD